MPGMVQQMTFQAHAAEARAIAQGLRKPVGPLLKIVAQVISADTKSNFDQSRDPDGVPWMPLKHPRLRGGDKPLRDRNYLMTSVTVSGAPGHVETISGSTLVYGSQLEYAAIHQYGGLIVPRGHPFLSIPAISSALDISPRNYPEKLHCIVGSVGGVLVTNAGQVVYYLARSVYIPARPYLGIGDRLGTKIMLAIEDYYFPGEAVTGAPAGMVRQGSIFVLNPARLGGQ